MAEFDPELVERAGWLAGRFVEAYGPVPPSSWTVIGAEEWMTRRFDWGLLVGRTDGLVEIDGEPWLIELKTYGSRPGPLAYASVSPQLGCYCLLAEAKYGRRPAGVLYQGIYTYQWKRATPVRLPEESFDQLQVELGSDHLLTAQLYLASAVDRRRRLRDAPYDALPNVGNGCGWCGFKARCWSELAGVEADELIVEPDATEPV